MSQKGRVSQVWPVQTAMCNCTRDKGRSFGVGDHVQWKCGADLNQGDRAYSSKLIKAQPLSDD